MKLVDHRIAHLIPGIERYVHDRIRPGGFMYAVLTNDLKQACARSDAENRYLLFEIVNYLYNEIPFCIWGSVEAVEAHLMKGQRLS